MVEYAEFEDYMASQIGDPISDEDTFETTADGFITGNELARETTMFGDQSYSKKEIHDMIAEADANSDRKVSDEGMTMSWGLAQDLPQLLSSFV